MKTHDELVDYLVENQYIQTSRIEEAFRKVDRANFAPQTPYIDRPVYLEYGATVSAPHIVAEMLELLEPEGKVLEMGSGSGYVQALLTQLTNNVTGVERKKTLVKKSRRKVLKARIIHSDSIPNEQFDRILYSFATKNFQEALEKSPIVVLPEIVDGGQVLKRYKNGAEQSFTNVRFVEERKDLSYD